MRSETTISPRPAGAGRSSDWIFPDPLQMFTTATRANQFRNRLNGQTIVAVVGGIGGGGATLPTLSGGPVGGGGSVTQSPTTELQGNGGGVGQLCRATNGPFVWLNILKSKGQMQPGANDYACTAVSLMCAYTGMVGAQSLDSGLQVTTTGGLLIGTGTPGFGFIRTALNQIKFVVMPVLAGAAIVTQVPNANGGTFDETALHEQRMIFTSANNTTEASVTALFDGIPFLTLPWGPAVNGVTMPLLDSVALGMVPQILMMANGTLQVQCPAGFHVASGPTVADVL